MTTVYNAINQIRTESNQSQSVGTAVRNSAPKDDSVSFSEYLTNALGTDGAQDNTGNVQRPAPVDQVALPVFPADTAVSAIDELLSALEEYETALGDSSVSLKELEPMVTSMEDKLQALGNEAANLADSELKDLANFAATQATVESIKFRRGDYV